MSEHSGVRGGPGKDPTRDPNAADALALLGPLEPLGPDEARARLALVDSASLATSRDRSLHVAFSGGIGIAVAVLLVLCWWMASHDNRLGLWLSIAGYGVVLALMFVLKGRAQAAPRGFTRVFNRGLGLTMTLYAVGIAWVFGHQDPWPTVTVVLGLAVVVAMPSLVAAVRIVRMGRR